MNKSENEKEPKLIRTAEIALSEIRAGFYKAASRASIAKEPTLVKRYGEPYVAIVPAEWLDQKQKNGK